MHCRRDIAIISLAVVCASGCGTNPNGSSILQAYTAWGDSLTVGGEGFVASGNYPADLLQILGPPALVINKGVGGQTSLQIGIREGGIPTTATITGGTIPASGSVGITFPQGLSPVTGPGIPITGTILGVQGTVVMSPTTGRCHLHAYMTAM